MYWFHRPPYLRWTAIGALIALGLFLELRPNSLIPHPYLVRQVQAGSPIQAADLEWKPTPRDLLPSPHLDDIVAARSLEAGEPLLPGSVLPREAAVPPGWWVLPLDVPTGAVPGQPARLIVHAIDLLAESTTISAMVVETPRPSSGLDLIEQTGSVAVPGESAPTVAAAAAEGRITVALLTGD